MRRFMCALLGGVCLLGSATAFGDLYGFTQITSNSKGDKAIGESQLSVDVTGKAGNQVVFTFQNIGSLACCITEVYFDDSGYLKDMSIGDTTGTVSFSLGANPKDLPSGGKDFNADFSAGKIHAAHNGVDPGETLSIVFDLQSGKSLAGVLTALNTGALQVGIHVQAFAGSGASESYINNTPVPVPSAVLLGMLGLGPVCWVKRRLR